MLEFIGDNYKWIFSGIGVAGLLVGWELWKRREEPANQFQPRERSGQTDELRDPPKSEERLSVEGIMERLGELTPLQQDRLAEEYEGIRVRLTGTVRTIERQRDSVSIQLDEGSQGRSGYGIFVDVDPDEYPTLSLLDKGDVLTVEGEIDVVFSEGEWIALQDGKILEGI